MSWAFITALKKNPQQSYVQLLNSIRDELATRYTQRPQLSCSHPLSESRPVSRPGLSPPCYARPSLTLTRSRHEPPVRHVTTYGRGRVKKRNTGKKCIIGLGVRYQDTTQHKHGDAEPAADEAR